MRTNKEQITGVETISANITALKTRIIALERPKGTPHFLPLGIAAIDLALGGGLAFGAVHEFADDVIGGAASLYVAALAAKAAGPVLWCTSSRAGDCIYPPGLMGFGLNPGQLIHFEARDDKDMLWAAHEALRAGAVKTVIAELRRGIDLASARKLQLAAESGGGMGLFLDLSARGRTTTPLIPAAITRWHIAGSAPKPTVSGSAIPQGGHANLHLVLTRNRRGALGLWDLTWQAKTRQNEGGQTMEQDHATHYFSLVSQTGDQPLYPHHAAMAEPAFCTGGGAG